MLLQTRPESVTEEKIKLISDIGVSVQVSLAWNQETREFYAIFVIGGQPVPHKESVWAYQKYGFRSNAYTMIDFQPKHAKKYLKQ